MRASVAHAAQMVLDAPVKKAMVPIDVTHTAIFTKQLQARLLSPDTPSNPIPATNLRYALSTVIGFFADSYKSTFGFNDGPPLHDALTVGYVSQPEFFKTVRKRVDVELGGTLTRGETVVDVWDYQPSDDTWGRGGENCLVAQSMDVSASFTCCCTVPSRLLRLGRSVLQTLARVRVAFRQGVSSEQDTGIPRDVRL